MKRLTALVLILAVFLSASPAAAAGGFTDVANSARPGRNGIEDMAKEACSPDIPTALSQGEHHSPTLVLLSRI